jgi:dsRNA-specific ribonuclease
VRCCRLLPRRTIKTQRKIEQKAQENFVQQATSTPASTLLTNPTRDSGAYDANPAIKFRSPSLAALHARIGLPASFPLSTLRRCLRDPSVEKDHAAHNEALSVLGSGLLEYYVAEYLCVRWPRLPMHSQHSAQWAYTGESALARVAREWGVKSRIVRPDGGEGKKKKEEVDVELVVATPGTATEKATQPYVESLLEYEVKEQEKVGWIEPSRGRKGGFGNRVQEDDCEKRFVLYAMRRFVQSLVGGVLVHSVHSPQTQPSAAFFQFLWYILLSGG